FSSVRGKLSCLEPGQAFSEPDRTNSLDEYGNPPSKKNVTVDFVIFSDGSTWGAGSNGTLKTFSTPTRKPAPQDNPPSGALGALQQVSGQKVIFWLDAPGRGAIYLDPNNSANTGPIDSMTDVKNFTSGICSKANPNVCYSVSWY